MLGRSVFVTENDVLLGDTGVHSRADGSRVRISKVADEEIVSWRERRFHAYEALARDERNSDARSHRSVPVDNNLHITLEISVLGEADAQVRSPPYVLQRRSSFP